MDLNTNNAISPYIFRLFLLILLGDLFVASPIFANSLVDAANALENENYTRARMLYTQLANTDDPVAIFNLGIMEKKGMGGPANPYEAHVLFEKASHLKLVNAYNAIQLASIQPAGNQRVLVIQSPQEWISAQKPNYYTLQLASSTNRKLIEKYYNENQLEGIAGYYVNRRKGEDWYALVYGAYSTVGEANGAIASLPQDLRKWSPWVRKLKDVQRLIKP